MENNQEPKNNNILPIVCGILGIFLLIVISGAIILGTGSSSEKAVSPNISTPKTLDISEKKVTFNQDANFDTYMPKMQNQIKANWNPPKTGTSSRVVMKYQIKKDGTLGSYEVKTSSGNTEMDNAAIDALKKSSPFPKLPTSYEGEYVDVEFTFDYNANKI